MRSSIRRPVSVTIIGCVEIAIGVLLLIQTINSLIRTGSMANQSAPDNPLPISLQLGISFISIVVSVVSGYYILKGINWGRWLFILWSVVCLLLFLITSPIKWMFLPSATYLTAIGYFLFRPEANRFFAAVATGAYVPVRPSLRSIISACFYIVAGFAFATSCMMAFFAYPEPAATAKLFVLMMILLPAAIFLALGRVVSENSDWKHEIGIVLIVSAAAGAWMSLSLALVLNDPPYQQPRGPDNSSFYSDYTMGGLWIAGMSLLGALLLHLARREASTQPIHAPIPGRKMR